MKRDIRSLDKDELTEWTVQTGEKPYRAKQIYGWLHARTVASLSEMSNIPKALKAAMEESFECTPLKEIMRQESALDATKKFLFGLPDGGEIESVFMKYRSWNSVCISSQVGCDMGCKFCASTIGGCERNLSTGELLSQVYEVQRISGEKISRVVVMGSGEPLENYDNLVKFIRMLTDPEGQGLSMRNITVSTCGLTEGIRALAKEDFSINLAISLHAATDEKRKQIMPVAHRYSLDELLKTCEDYFQATGRQLTFEYALIDGFNDTQEDVNALAWRLKPLNCVVNLIPLNPVRERSFKEPDSAGLREFKNKLENYGINVTIRREMGRDIDGACGQLRAGHAKERKKEISQP